MKKILSSITAVVFLMLIFGIGMVNAFSVFPKIKESVAKTEYPDEKREKIEEEYRTKFWGYKNWINLYGLAQKIEDRTMIGEMQFVKTDTGLMDYITKDEDVMPFANEMAELKQRLDERNIPLLYVQMPAREEENQPLNGNLLKTNAYYQQIRTVTDAAKIDCMDEKDILDESLPREKFYFKTDIHTTTDGEIQTAGKIAERLNKNYGITIKNLIEPDDKRFSKRSYLFLGNLAQSVGVCYNGVDRFEEYIPKETTSFCLSELTGQWETTGSFEEVLMNGYSAGAKTAEEEIYTYWVTDYLKYGVGCYNIENLNKSGTSLLFICDSLCYRTIAYMAMECANITVLDPRFYTENVDYIAMAFDQRDYDAVIYLHGSFYTTDYSMFGRGAFGQK